MPTLGLQEWAASAERLLQDMHDPSSPYQPYFAVLPGRDAVWSWFDLPDSYLPLIQNKALVRLMFDLND
jgi:hypothetical protein